MSKRYLIDTHILLWYLDGNVILPGRIRDELNNKDNQVFVSTASLWELSIKLSKEKLDINVTLQQVEDHIVAREYQILNISFKHLNTLLTLPLVHGDPFDRMLISQAISESLTLISVDRHFDSYPIKLLK